MLAQRTRARKKKKKKKEGKGKEKGEKITSTFDGARVRIEEETKKGLVELARKTGGISNDRVSISS